MSGLARLVAALAVGLATAVAGAQGAARPQYLPFAEFASTDSASHLAVKQAYNEAVERYNKALYDYHTTLGQHDQLVEQHSRAGTLAEQEKARADAAPLRAKLQTLRREVTSLAAAVDQARRRASQSGVTLTP
jgi:ribosomal protein S12 methylthiotransferase accessory factor YcaO